MKLIIETFLCIEIALSYELRYRRKIKIFYKLAVALLTILFHIIFLYKSLKQ